MDQNLLIAGGVAFVALMVGFVRSDRAQKRQQQEARAKAAKAKSAAKTKAAAVTNAKSAARPVPAMPPDEDVEITLIATFPIAELAKARAKAAGALVVAGASEDAEGAAPTLTAEAPAPSGDQRPSRVELSFEEEAEAEEVTSPVVRILISATGDSDQGRIRRKNEDSLLVFPERSLYAVADGMGGHAGGEIASALAVDVLRDAFERGVFEAHTESSSDVPRRGRELACAIQMANEAIYQMAQDDPKLFKMGTTMVAARFSPNKQRVYIGHVGDSRCYRLRGDDFRQLTKDHVMSTFGVTGPRGNDLYQAVGVQPTLSIDLIVDKPRETDVYLLCSDGLSKMMNNDEIGEVLRGEQDLEAAVYGLMEIANDRGGRDNITLILVKVLERPVKSLALS